MKCLIPLLSVFALTSAAWAQEPIIPIELRAPHSIRLDGTSLTFCITAGGPIVEYEKAVGEAIASVLLLEPVFIEESNSFPLYDETDLTDTVYQLLNEKCEAYLGFNLLSNTYPTWLRLSRPYASIPYTFAVIDDDYRSLGDVPTDRPIGTPMMSVAESAYVTYALTIPQRNRWQRFPYGNDVLMLERVIDGTIEGAFFWIPSLHRAATALGNSASTVRAVSPDPVRIPPANVGIAVLANQAFLLNALDEAIAALGSDGTLAELLTEFEIEGQAAP